MGEPAAPAPGPAQPGLDVLTARALAAIEGGTGVVRQAMDRCGPLPELLYWAGRLAEAEREIRQAAVFRDVQRVHEALAAVPDLGAAPRQRHRHRVPRQRGERPLFPRSASAFVPAAGLLAALRAIGTALRHSPAAHHVTAAASWAGQHTAAVVTAGAGTGLVAVAVTVGAVTGHPAAGHPGDAAAVPAPAASAVSASLIPSPVQSSRPVNHGNADANRAGELGVIPLAPWSLPSASPSASPPPSPSPSAGTLTASTAGLTLGADGVTYSGQVTITAQGAGVTWGAVSSDSADVTVSAVAGFLGAGQSVWLTISVAPGAQASAGSAVVRVYPGIVIDVSWLAAPPPSASPAATDTPTPDPSSS